MPSDPVLTPPPAPRSSADQQLDHPVRFSAQDSLILTFDENGDIVRLIGKASVTYGETRLDAHEIDLLFDLDEMRARGLASDTGLTGRPRFQRGQESFTGRNLAYNMRTDRGRVVGARSAIQDGFLHGEVIKQEGDSILFVADGAYTTCDLEDDPHYTLRSNRMKIVNEDWIFSGPIHLRIFNIPMPLWLPFGVLPATEGRRSGPLAPRYGEDERGFFLRDLGWYWAMNDYMDFQTRAGIWSLGSWQVAPLYRYAKREHFSGQVQLDWTRSRRGERRDPTYLVQDSRSFRWNHNQTIDPTASLNADVNLSSRNYLRTVSELYDDRVRQTISSSVRYNKRWPSVGRNVSVNLRHSQTVETGATNMTIPSLSFSQSTRHPFRRSRTGAGTSDRWYERISYNISSTVDNQFRYSPISDSLAQEVSWWDALWSPSEYRRATGQDTQFDFQARHRIPISAPFSLERIPLFGLPIRLNLSPNFNYEESWHLQTERRHFDEGQNRVIREDIPGFTAIRRFNTGISANTEFFGIFPFRIGRFNGFRHTVRPNISFSYAPDYSSDFWGYYRTYTDAQGREINYPVVSGIPSGRQQTMSLSINNVFQTRIVSSDTTGERRSQTVNLLNLGVNSSYNFAADSMGLSNVSLNGRTRLFDQFDFSFNSVFSPYATNEAGQTINRLEWHEPGIGFLRLVNFNATIRTTLRSRRGAVGRPFGGQPAHIDQPLQPSPGHQGVMDDPFISQYFNTPVGYADFAIPWSMNVDLTYRQTRTGNRLNRRAIINSRFDFNLTPNWKVQGATGYDLVEREISTTQISVLRDLHCWEMAFNWYPFGRYQSYSFTLRVKSGHLRDILRLNHPRSDIRDRFGSML